MMARINLHLTDLDMLDILDDEAIQAVQDVYTSAIEKMDSMLPPGISGAAEWHLFIFPSSNRKGLRIDIKHPAVNATRVFDLSSRELEHSFFAIHEKLQGKGLSAPMMEASANLADRVKVSKINLNANVTIGGYAWLRKGALPGTADIPLNIWLEEIIDSRHIREGTDDLKKLAREFVEEIKGKSTKDLKVFFLSPEFKKYKPVFLGADWDGSFDPNDGVTRTAMIKGAEAAYEQAKSLARPIRQTTRKKLTANEEIFNAYVRHQTGIIRYAGGLRNQVAAKLNKTETALADLIIAYAARMENESPSSRRAAELFATMQKRIGKIRADAWKEVSEEMIQELTQFAVQEAALGINIIQGAVPVALGMTMPSVSHLKRVAEATPFEGRTLREWLAHAENVDAERLSRTAKMAIAAGETPTQAARQVVGTASQKYRDGAARKAIRDMESILLTVTNGIQNQAKSALYEENSDLVKTEYYVATLDARTTLVCASNDGKRFNRGEGPIPPLHFRCRSLRIPLIDVDNLGNRGFDSSTQRQLLDEFKAEQGIEGTITTRADLPRGTKGAFDQFARKRKRQLVGSIPGKTTYNQWLKNQSSEFQNEVLGPTRAKIFREGNLSLDKFVARDGDTLTLDQLASAGLEIPAP